MKRVVLIDFDGTITLTDTLNSILKNFAIDSWKEIEDQWLKGTITTIACLELQVALICASPNTLFQHVREIPIDEGIHSLINYTSKNAIPFEIVSDGLRTFIYDYLSSHDIHGITIHSNDIDLTQSPYRMVFPNKNHLHASCATCKGKIVERFQNQGYEVVFVGDGHSDRCAVKSADLVFAKDSLANFCIESQIPFHPYKNLHDVERILSSNSFATATLES
jgi:2,3-diketo-5-methylthio-1-phosphopentane phosphatase